MLRRVVGPSRLRGPIRDFRMLSHFHAEHLTPLLVRFVTHPVRCKRINEYIRGGLYDGKDKKARASLRFWERVFMTVGRIATCIPRAEMAGDWDLSAGAMTKVPVESASSLATPRAEESWPR